MDAPPIRAFKGDRYIIEINSALDSVEPTICIYDRTRKCIEAAAWHFPDGVEYLRDAREVDTLVQKIFEHGSFLEREVDQELDQELEREGSDLFRAYFVHDLSAKELALLQDFVLNNFGFVPYEALGRPAYLAEKHPLLSLPGLEKKPVEKEYPTSAAMGMEREIIENLKKIRSEKLHPENPLFVEALGYLRSEEVEKYGRDYWKHHTRESKLSPVSLDLIREFLGQ